ncbi:50S ribosomal protein L25 [bacterium]|nr:50S ribosomal protein L25 [bacterium]
MQIIDIEVSARNDLGTGKSNTARRQGLVPGVVYSEGTPALPLLVNGREYGKKVYGKKQTQLFRFTSVDSKLNGMMALVKDAQIEPLRDEVMHVDFYSIHEGKKITVPVPVELTGECPAVKSGDAILNQTGYEVEVECLPTAIPDQLTVDISGLAEGHSIHAADLQMPEGVRLKTDPKTSIVSAITAKEMQLETPVAAATAEGEAATAEGAAAAPAADAKADAKKADKK